MTHATWRTAAAAALGTLWLAAVAAAERPHLDSHPNDGPIIVDGRHDDWSGSLQPFGNEPLSIQVANDGEFLYVRLASSDPGVRMQLTRLGLTVWLDPKGGTSKTLGVRYPIIEQAADGERGNRGYGRGERRAPKEREPGEAAENFTPPDRVDVLGPGKNDGRSLTREHLPGIEVAMALDRDTVRYELKIPLAATADRPYAIGARAGQTIGLGIETAKFEASSRQGRGDGMGGRGGGYGGGGMGGRRGGYGGGSRSERRGDFQPPKQIKAWATVLLH